MLGYSLIENQLLALLADMPKLFNAEVKCMPADWQKDGKPYVRNCVLIMFVSDDSPIASGSRVLTGMPLQSMSKLTFKLIIASQRLRASSQAGCYELIAACKERLHGVQLAEHLPPISMSNTQFMKRTDDYWVFSSSLELLHPSIQSVRSYAPPIVP